MDITLCFNICTRTNVSKLLFNLATLCFEGLLNEYMDIESCLYLSIMQNIFNPDTESVEKLEEELKNNGETSHYEIIYNFIIKTLQSFVNSEINEIIIDQSNIHIKLLTLLLILPENMIYKENISEIIINYIYEFVLNDKDIITCFEEIIRIRDNSFELSTNEEIQIKELFDIYETVFYDVISNNTVLNIQRIPTNKELFKNIKCIIGIDIYKNEMNNNLLKKFKQIFYFFADNIGIDKNNLTFLYPAENVKASIMRNTMIQIAQSGTKIIFSDDDDAHCGLTELLYYIKKVLQLQPNIKIFKLPVLSVQDINPEIPINYIQLHNALLYFGMWSYCLDRNFVLQNHIFNPPNFMLSEDVATSKIIQTIKHYICKNEIIIDKLITEIGIFVYLYMIPSNRYEDVYDNTNLYFYYKYSLLSNEIPCERNTEVFKINHDNRKYELESLYKYKEADNNIEKLTSYESYNKYTIIDSKNPNGKIIYLFNVFRKNKEAKLNQSTGEVLYKGKTFKNKKEWEEFICTTMKDTPKKIKFFGGNFNTNKFFIMLCYVAVLILIIVIIILLCKNNQFKRITCSKLQL